MEDSQPKPEPSAERKAVGYKSWKKKYRKMRIVFDEKMATGEELHRKEAKTAQTVKRLAVENEYVTDLMTSNGQQLTRHALLADFSTSFSRSTIPNRSPLTSA
ncbi:hypothetical protein NLG97_g4422 [Lecanicillium saksenae]|uniref:Uncharacterized protein n=1 Tax=Lecanicillium saksenae TaxID=468837 RepID=A0ACC1QWZ8_9HYPO|nr:hypothetical protein NLG97_g4422 [Lecanicillium saksenae]